MFLACATAHSPSSDTPTAGAAAAASALPAATELDLDQSLATLKIALTQQHVAAAAGSVGQFRRLCCAGLCTV